MNRPAQAISALPLLTAQTGNASPGIPPISALVLVMIFFVGAAGIIKFARIISSRLQRKREELSLLRSNLYAERETVELKVLIAQHPWKVAVDLDRTEMAWNALSQFLHLHPKKMRLNDEFRSFFMEHPLAYYNFADLEQLAADNNLNTNLAFFIYKCNTLEDVLLLMIKVE